MVLGSTLGSNECIDDGMALGILLGSPEGIPDGETLGVALGLPDGVSLGGYGIKTPPPHTQHANREFFPFDHTVL